MARPLARALVALGVATTFAAVAVRKVGDFDLPWHLASGRQLVAEHAIPHVDDFAYTHRPIEHVDALSDLAFYAVYRAGGALGLQLFTAALSVAIGLVLWATVKKEGPAAWLAVALALGAMSAWLLARPATVGFLFLAVTMLLLSRDRDVADQPLRKRRALCALPPLFFAWTCSHPSIFIGVVILLGYAAYRAACAVLRGRAGALFPAEDGAGSPSTAAAAVLGVAAVLLSPGGATVMLGPLRAHADMHLVTEWASPTLSFITLTEPGTGLLLLVALAALVFGRGPKGRIPNAFDLGIVLLALALGATAVRLLAVGAVLLAPFVARRLASSIRPTALMEACAGGSLLLVGPVLLAKSDVGLGIGFEETHYPEAAVLWIKEKKPAGHMYNFMPFGGYLSLRLYPEQRVLIDGRQAFVHGHELVERVERADVDPEAMSKLVRDYEIEWAITRSREGEPFGRTLAISREFTMVFFDDVAAVYAKNDGPNAELARGGYQVFRHLMPLEIPLRDALQAKRGDAWSHDGALAAVQAPKSPRAHFVDACGAIAAKDRQRFDAALAELARLAPQSQPMNDLLRAAWQQRQQKNP